MVSWASIKAVNVGVEYRFRMFWEQSELIWVMQIFKDRCFANFACVVVAELVNRACTKFWDIVFAKAKMLIINMYLASGKCVLGAELDRYCTGSVLVKVYAYVMGANAISKWNT